MFQFNLILIYSVFIAKKKTQLNYIREQLTTYQRKKIMAVGKDQKGTYEPFELVHPKTTTDISIKKKLKN